MFFTLESQKRPAQRVGKLRARCACSQGSIREKRLNLSSRDFREARNARRQGRKHGGGRLVLNLVPWSGFRSRLVNR